MPKRSNVRTWRRRRPGTPCIPCAAQTPLIPKSVHAFIWPFSRAARRPCSGHALHAPYMRVNYTDGARSSGFPILCDLDGRCSRQEQWSHWHQSTSRRLGRLNGAESARRCTSQSEPSTLCPRRSTGVRSRRFADVRLGDSCFTGDPFFIDVCCFIGGKQLRLAVPDQRVVEDLARGGVPSFVDQTRRLGRSGHDREVLEGLDEYPLVAVLRVQACQRKKSPLQRRSSGGTRSGRR